MNRRNYFPDFSYLLRTRHRPSVWANILGSANYPEITGSARFYETDYGVFVITEVRGLPEPNIECREPIFAFHIHDGDSCGGEGESPFPGAGMHYNPYGCPHPYHAGDMPPLFSAGGLAYSAFLTDRFTISEIVGKTVIIHSAPDDFTTQPSGNPGEKIACGEIVR
ncbi:MAG: superoxide dismutase family protein [Clostridia bacterium]|nr:superoxide dismutase family protein [Clostridia bacterium]